MPAVIPATAASENYCVCVGEDGAPREIGRSGTAVTYKAMGYQSGQPVALQLIPLASVSDTGREQFEARARAVRKLKHPNIARVFDVRVEDDHLVFATEYLQGETAEQWVVAHGPMPPDAVARIGLQVVSALAEAAFHSLSHRAIQPSNLMIVSGAAPDGDWPFVKLLNFGLAGLKIYSDEKDDLAPPVGAAFASPEQIEKGKVDFRSEIFSLGATMCFLLTGAVATAGRARRSGTGERVLPSGGRIPRPLRKLLRRMLRLNPDERPRDPLLLTDELRRCLEKVRRRRAFTRAAPLPLEVQPLAPVSRNSWLGPMLTAATVLLLLAALAAVLLPGQFRWWTQRDRPLDSIGVPIGVPENAPPAVRNSASPSAAEVAENNSTAPSAEENPGRIEQLLAEKTSSPPPAMSAAPEPSAAVAQGSPAAEPIASAPPEVTQASPVPAEMPPAAEQQPSAPAIAQNSPAAAESSAVPSESVAQSADAIQNAAPVTGQSAAREPGKWRATGEVAINNRMAEPPPPAEAPPPQTETSPPPENSPQPSAVTQRSSPPDEAKENGDAESEQASLPPKGVARSNSSSAAAKTNRANSTASRRGNVRSSRDHVLPPMRVGSEQAQFVRTTDEGKWMLRLPSGETVVTPPLPRINVSDAPVISHRKVRKVQAPPRALPAENGPPVVVLPPND